MEVPIDYHILFLAMSFILFVISIFLIFVDTSLEKAVGATILIMFNMVLCIIVGYVFAAVDLYSYDSSGALVHNVYSGMHYLSYIYLVLFYVNILLMVYCAYLFIRKPWSEVYGDESKIRYKGPPY